MLRSLTTTTKLIMVAVVIAILALTHIAVYVMGGDGCERRHAQKQLEINERLNKADDKIDRNTPFTADKRTAIEWLRQHTRRE